MRARVTMLSLVFLFTLLGSCLSGSLTAAAAPEYWAAGRTDEPLAGDNQRVVLVVPEGQGDGEVYYRWRHPSSSEIEGPSAFAVAENGIYVLDKDNQRIAIWEEDGYRSIDIGEPGFRHMLVQDGKIAVTSMYDSRTKIFSVEGELLHEFDHGKSTKEFYPHELYDNTVVLRMRDVYCLRYNWENGQTNTYAYPDRLIEEQLVDEAGELSTLLQKKEDGQQKWVVPGSPWDDFVVIGVYEDELYYREDTRFVRQEMNGKTWVAARKYPENYVRTRACYISDDGRLYVLEVFYCKSNGKYMVISEILFDTYSRYLSENAAVQWSVSRSLEMQEVERCRME